MDLSRYINLYVTACNFTKIELLHRCLSKVLKKWRNYVEESFAAVIFKTASLKRYFSTRFSHVLIIESRVGSCENILVNRVETSHITSPLNCIWIEGWFSLPLCIPLHGTILLPWNPFCKWMKLEKTNIKLIEL